MSAQRGVGISAGALLVAPAVCTLLVLFVVPLALFGTYGFLEGTPYGITSDPTLTNVRDVLTDEVVHRLAWNSIVIGAATSIICLLIGLPLAYFMRFKAGRFEYVLLALVVLSLFVSYLARIYSWRTILGQSGVVNETLALVGIGPREILFTRSAVILAHVEVFIPYIAITVYAAMRNLPRDLLDVSSDLGAGSLQTWRRVLLPLLAPAIFASLLYTFVLSASDFFTPRLLGGPNANTLSVYVSQQFVEYGNFAAGAAISVVMLTFFLACFGATVLLLRVLGLRRVSVRF